MRSNQFQIYTFGCKVNTYDTGLVVQNLNKNGFTSPLSPASDASPAKGHIHILNTCAVTAEATKEATRMVRRIRARDTEATVVVTGCAAQVDTDVFSNLPGVNLVVANSHKGMLPEILEKYFKGTLSEKVFKSNIFRKDDLEAGGGLEENHSRAFLKIQDGCNSFCSFCIIPYARGKSRSLSVVDLVSRVNHLHSQGFEEIVLTGVHIGDYEDGQKRLEDLLEALLRQTRVPRFRLTSLEPIEISARLLELYRDPRMCPHFHMSIQSGSSSVLRQMKRKYGEHEVRESLEKIATAVPGAFVGMDVIAGFPTETEAEFEETYRTLCETPWTRLHVFPYSERSGTRAAIMEQIPMSVRKARARRLRDLSLERYQSHAQKQFGTSKLALLLRRVTRDQSGQYVRQAVSRDYWTMNVEVPSHVLEHQGEVRVRITDFDVKARMEGILRGVYESGCP